MGQRCGAVLGRRALATRSAPAGALVVCSAEGKGAPIRGTEPAPAVERMHASGGPQPGRKKIAWVGSVYTVMPFVRTPEEVCKSLFEAAPAEASPARPKPQCKRLRASLLRDAQQSTQPALDEVFGWMAREVQGRTPAGRHPIVMVMDGQETLWDAGLKHLPEERFEVIEVLDVASTSPRISGKRRTCFTQWAARGRSAG
jgi:hypothetical protein